LIYIKDYRSLNSLVFQPQQSTIQMKLTTLIGKIITVFVDSGGASGNGFTGVLIEVLNDSIKLVTKLPEMTRCNSNRSGNVFNQSCNRQHECSKLGTNTIIIINHITAFTYRDL